MRFILILLMFKLTACATVEGYERNLNSWVGASESDLVSHWGPPQEDYKMNDGKIITYHFNGGSYAFGQQGLNNSYVINNVNYWCKTHFYINNGDIITNWRWEGNSCKAQ